MSRWLDGFAYRIAVGPGVFLLAGALVLAIALVTVGTQALRAATTDPVKALRYE
jgi:putative ABC transport system permease protein